MYLNNLNAHKNSLNIKNLRSEYHIGPNIGNCGGSFVHCAKRGNSVDSRIVAGLKIFAFIMLQSWRKSRKEIKQLKNSVEDLKLTSTRRETQVCVYNSLIKMEQNRADALTRQLKRTMESLIRRRLSCKTFSMTLSNLKNSQVLLEQELKSRSEESEALSEVLEQNKKQLFRSMMEQRNLHSQLCKEQRTVQSLENDKRLLITEICDLNREHRRVEEKLIQQLKHKDNETMDLMDKCQARCFESQRTQKNWVNIKNGMQLHITDPQKNFHGSICRSLGMLWTRFVEYPKYTLSCVHILSYYLLPAVPAPSPAYKSYSAHKIASSHSFAK